MAYLTARKLIFKIFSYQYVVPNWTGLYMQSRRDKISVDFNYSVYPGVLLGTTCILCLSQFCPVFSRLL